MQTKRLLKFSLALLMSGSLFFNAMGQNKLSQAEAYLKAEKTALGLTDADLQYDVTDNYVSKHNGVNHVFMTQTYNGIQVNDAYIGVHVKSNGEVFRITNDFVGKLSQKVATSSATLTHQDAIVKAAQAHGLTVGTMTVKEQKTGAANEIVFSDAGISADDITVKLMYQADENGELRLVYDLSIHMLDHQNWYNTKVDAQTGAILREDNLVLSCSFGEHAIECAAGEETPTSFNDDEETSSSVNSSAMVGSYNVLPLGTESPTHGPRALVSNPDDATSSPFGWHDTNGSAGPEYTITRGNNAHAYEDVNNSGSGTSPDGGSGLVFDFPFDQTAEPVDYQEAAITNLFYWNNLMHDIWYHYGFDEASGNFQQNNYGNGGQGGDYVLAQAQDNSTGTGAQYNNANFSTPGDGSNPQMQMYLWNYGSDQGSFVTINSPSNIAGDYAASAAVLADGWGGYADPAITAPLVQYDDAVGAAPTPANTGDGGIANITSDACDDLHDDSNFDMTNTIAMVDRRACQFGFKAFSAETSGAIGVIICNHTPGAGTVPMAGGDNGGDVNIPTVMMSYEDCQSIRAELPNVSVTIEILEPDPNGIQFLDGDFDNGIIAHEYGHGISTRLTGGPSTSCLNSQEQQGEGWSDYFGLVLTTNADLGDQATDGRGIGTYASTQPTSGGGIRTYRYSTDMVINPHTYADIATESVPHGVGSVWCAMIWDLYWAMIDEHGYDADLYNGTGGNNMANLLILDGIKLQGCNPGFVTSRDAILDADDENYNGANACLIWSVFARRGLGFSADQGSVDDVADSQEGYDLPPSCDPTAVKPVTIDPSFVNVYPNPAQNEVFITLNNEAWKGDVTLNMMDVTGRMITNTVVESQMLNNYSINVSDLSAGVYFVKLQKDNQVITKKVIVQ